MRAAFEMANVKLTTLSGGFGSNASVVANLEGLTKVMTTLASTVQKQTEQMAAMSAHMVRLGEDAAAAHQELATLRQLVGSGTTFTGAATAAPHFAVVHPTAVAARMTTTGASMPVGSSSSSSSSSSKSSSSSSGGKANLSDSVLANHLWLSTRR